MCFTVTVAFFSLSWTLYIKSVCGGMLASLLVWLSGYKPGGILLCSFFSQCLSPPSYINEKFYLGYVTLKWISILSSKKRILLVT